MYLYNKQKKKTAAHIWTGEDTACKMWSTGGMRKGKKELHTVLDDRRVCVMCQNNEYKMKFQSLLNDPRA